MTLINADAEIDRLDKEIADPRNADSLIELQAAKIVLLQASMYRAVEARPVVHTRWAHLGGDEWCCPACGFVITTEGSWEKPHDKHCRDCGANMDAKD